MKLNIQHVFRDLKPYRVVSDLGLPIRTEGDRHFTASPQDARLEVQITEEGFVGMSPRCGFLGGNLYDYLADRLGGYPAAVQHVLQHYPELAVNPSVAPLETHAGYFVRDLQNARRQFHNILRLRQNWTRTETNTSGVCAWLRSKGIDSRSIAHVAFPAAGKELSALTPGASASLKRDAVYLVLPFLMNHHTVARLAVFDFTEDARQINYQLQPATHSFFGLHSSLGQQQQTRLCSDALEAMRSLTHMTHSSCQPYGAVAVATDPEGTLAGLRLESGLVVLNSADLSKPARLRALCKDFHVSHQTERVFPVADPLVPWRDYAFGLFRQAALEDQRYSDRVATLVQSLKLDPEVTKLVLDWLAQQPGLEALLKRARRQMETRDAFMVGNLQILSTDYGYAARRAGREQEIPFTNFQIKIDNTVWFEENEEMFYSGRVVISDGEYPILFHRQLAAKPSELESLATAAVRRCARQENPPLPLITDTTYKRHLYTIVARQAATKPQIIGVRRLGWNRHKTAFVTPTWRAEIMGISPTSRIAYPGAEPFNRQFSFAAPNLQSAPLDSSRFRSLLALAVAVLGRAFRGDPIPRLSFLHSPGTRLTLQALFKPLGQVEPYEINSNRRAGNPALINPEFFSGYPMLAVCASDRFTENASLPVFLLSAAGLSAEGVVSAATFDQAVALAHEILTAAAVGLIRQRGGGYELATASIPSVRDLIAEGQRAVEVYSDRKEFSVLETVLPAFQDLLGRVPFGELSHLLQYDIPTQSLRLRRAAVPMGVNWTELSRELLACPGVEHGADGLMLPYEWTSDLLHQHHGKAAQLYASTTPEPVSEPAVEEPARRFVTH